MTQATSRDIGNAIADDLNGYAPGWPASFTAARGYLTTARLDAVTDYECIVTAARRSSEQVSRSITRNTLAFVLCFVKKLAAVSTGAVDPLIETVEAVQDVYAEKRALTVAGNTKVAVQSADADPLYSEVFLDEQSLFVALLNVIVEVWN